MAVFRANKALIAQNTLNALFAHKALLELILPHFSAILAEIALISAHQYPSENDRFQAPYSANTAHLGANITLLARIIGTIMHAIITLTHTTMHEISS